VPEGTEREAKLKFQTEGAEQLIGSLDRLIERLERVQSAVGGGAAAQPSTGYGSAAATQPAAVPAGGGLSLFQSQSAIPLQTGGVPSPQQQALQAQGHITTATPTSWRMTAGGVYAPPGYAAPVQGALVPVAGGLPALPPQAPAPAQPAGAQPTPTGYGPTGLDPFTSIVAYAAYRQTGVLPAGLGYQYLHQAAIGAAGGYTINQLTAPAWQIEQAYATGQYVTPEARGRAMWGLAQPAGAIGGGIGLGVLGAIIGSIVPGVGTVVGGAVGAGLGGTLGYGQGGAYAGVRMADLSRQEQIRVLAEQLSRRAGGGLGEAGGIIGMLYSTAAQAGQDADSDALRAATLDLARGVGALTQAAPQLAQAPGILQWAGRLQAGGPETFPQFAEQFGGLMARPESATLVQRMVRTGGGPAVRTLLARAATYAARGDMANAQVIIDAIARENTRTTFQGTALLPGPAGTIEVPFGGRGTYEAELAQGRELMEWGPQVRAAQQYIGLFGAWGAYWGAEAEARGYAGADWAGAGGRGYAMQAQRRDAQAQVERLGVLIDQMEGSPQYETDPLWRQQLAQYKAQRAALAPVASGYAAARAGVGYYGAMAQAGIAGAGAAVAARRTLGLPWAGALEERRGAELALGGAYEWFATQAGVPVEEAAQYRAMAAGQRAQALGTRFEAIEAQRLAVEIPAKAEYGIAGTRMGAAVARGEIWTPIFAEMFDEMRTAVEKQVTAKKKEIADTVAEAAAYGLSREQIAIRLQPRLAELRGLEAQLPGIARQAYEMEFARRGIPVAAAQQIAGAQLTGLFGAGMAYGPALTTALGGQREALAMRVDLAREAWQRAAAMNNPELERQAAAQYATAVAEQQGLPPQQIRTWQAGEQMIPGYQMGAGGAEAARARMAYGMLGALPAARQQIAGAYQIADIAGQALGRAQVQGLGPQVLAEFGQAWQQAQTQAAMTTLQALAPGLPAATEEAMAQADFQRAVLGMTWTSRGSLRQTVRQQMGASYQAVQDLVGQRDAAMREARTPEERIRLARTYNDSIRQAWMGVVSAEQQLEQGWQERIVSAFWGMPANANLALEEFNYAGAVTRGGAFGRHLGGTSAQTEYYRRQPLYGTSYAGAGLFNVPLTFMSSGLAGISQGMPWGAGTPDLGALANASLVGGAIEAHIHVHVHYPDGSETYHKVVQSVDVSNVFARRVPVQSGS